MSGQRLVVFDMDGTLVDSEAHIVLAMTHAYESIGKPAPRREDIHAIIGLSLPVAFARLSPQGFGQHGPALDAAYRSAYADLRHRHGAAVSSPMFKGAREALMQIGSEAGTLLGVATGKSRRGLDALITAHGLQGCFATTQVADDHPSKPDPSMLTTALAQTGVEAANAVMIGDTSYDIKMGHAAGFATVGVGWGYHPADALMRAGADIVVDAFSDLTGALNSLWGAKA